MKPLYPFDPVLAEEICMKTATSPLGLKALCRENPHWPSRDVIYAWAHKNKEFRDQYARAKAFQIEWLVDEALEIAMDGSKDTIHTSKGMVCDKEWVIRSRLIVDTIKWRAAKLAPRIYGDKLQLSTNVTADDPELIKARKLVKELKKHGRIESTES